MSLDAQLPRRSLSPTLRNSLHAPGLSGGRSFDTYRKADARTRTGDPFITSEVRPQHAPTSATVFPLVEPDQGLADARLNAPVGSRNFALTSHGKGH